MASTTWSMRLALLLCLTVVVLGALAADELTPLFERRGEVEGLELASHVARTAAWPDLTDVPPGDLRAGADPPLAPALFALGLRVAGIHELRWLARRNPSVGDRDRVVWLHGPDEAQPWSEPVRRLHAVRSVGLAAAALLVLAVFRLARSLAPGSRAAPCAAAALAAINPGLWSNAGAFTGAVWGAALLSLALAQWLDLRRIDGHAGAGRILLASLSLGLAVLATNAAWVVLPVALAVLWQRRRAEGGVRVGELLIGLLLPVGPWMARQLALYGDPLALALQRPGGRTGATASLTFLEDLLYATFGEWGHHLQAGGNLLQLWILALVGGVAGLLWQLLRTRDLDRGAVAGCVAALGLHVVALLLLVHGRSPAHGSLGVLLVGPLLALVAVGWRAWLVGGVARPLALVALLALGALGAWDQRAALERVYWPLNRAHDGHLQALDVLAAVPDEARLPVLAFSDPPDGSIHVLPPTLRWATARDPRARYSVHLSYPGLATIHRSWEDDGVVASDRLTVPTSLWRTLPRGVPLLARLVRLPDPAVLAREPLETLTLEVSPQHRVYRDDPPNPADAANDDA